MEWPARPSNVRVLLRSLALLVPVLTVALPSHAASLKGSKESIRIQTRKAQEHDYSYLATPGQVRDFVKQGFLVPVPGNANYELAGVSYPYARPELKLFLERLAAQYRRATGEKLVVTSLTRPTSKQPRNASRDSVHPTGMAADIRRSSNAKAQRWLEKTLLTLEAEGVIEATKERRPPHYHVALFADDYLAYLGAEAAEPAAASLASASPATVRVGAGDSLWGIAQRHGTTVDAIRSINELRSNRIYPGQLLRVPTR